MSAGALILGFYLPRRGEARELALDAPITIFKPNAWLLIGVDNRITVLVEKPELGQGSRTYAPMMIAEELEADWSTIRVEQAPTIPAVYPGLRTGGSGGVASTFTSMRSAGAQALEMLLTAAAQQWKAKKRECRAENGVVIHAPTHRRLSYGELVQVACQLPPLNSDEIPLKSPGTFRCIGKAIPRTDTPGKVDGSAVFGMDVRVPGMLFAVVARCPYFGGTLESFEVSAARSVPGVRALFPIPPLPRHINTAGGVAVVADSTWAAIEGRKALALKWEKGPGEGESTDSLRKLVAQRAIGAPTLAAVDRGDAVEGSKDAALSGLSPEKVTVHMTLSGGSFGRRYQWDYAAEAWQVAKEMKQPVQLMWTREDDIQHDLYRPYSYQRLTACFDERGDLAAWSTRVVTTPTAGSNLYTGFTESPETLRDPATVAALEWYGADVAPYSVPNFHLDYAPADSGVPRSWWRSVASSNTPYAKECFVDELAHARGCDPLRFRLDLLKDSSPGTARLRRVLELAAKNANWGKPLPKDHGQDIACRVGGSCSAQVAEVSVNNDGAVNVHRVVSAVDCGIAVNPDGVRAMTEGAINFALTAVLTGEITIKD